MAKCVHTAGYGGVCMCDDAVCDEVRWFLVTQCCCGSGSLEAEAEIRLDGFQIDTC